jgi:hypothetical protein
LGKGRPYVPGIGFLQCVRNIGIFCRSLFQHPKHSSLHNVPFLFKPVFSAIIAFRAETSKYAIKFEVRRAKGWCVIVEEESTM